MKHTTAGRHPRKSLESPRQHLIDDDSSDEEILKSLPQSGVRFEARDGAVKDPFQVAQLISENPELAEYNDLSMIELEARAAALSASSWDRSEELFASFSVAASSSSCNVKPQAALVFLHAAGDCGSGMQAWLGHASSKIISEDGVVDESTGEDFEERMARLGVTVLFPDAPKRPYTPSGGARVQTWFDRVELSWVATDACLDLGGGERDSGGSSFAGAASDTGDHRQQGGSLALHNRRDDDAATAAVEGAIERARKQWGIPRHRVFVGGFGQGGAMALHFACFGHGPPPRGAAKQKATRRLGGVFVLSNYLPAGCALWREALGVEWKKKPSQVTEYESSSEEEEEEDDDDLYDSEGDEDDDEEEGESSYWEVDNEVDKELGGGDDDEACFAMKAGVEVDPFECEPPPPEDEEEGAEALVAETREAKAAARRTVKEGARAKAKAERKALRRLALGAARADEEVAALFDASMWEPVAVAVGNFGGGGADEAAAATAAVQVLSPQRSRSSTTATITTTENRRREEKEKTAGLPCDVFLSHGTDDQMVPLNWAHATAHGLLVAAKAASALESAPSSSSSSSSSSLSSSSSDVWSSSTGSTVSRQPPRCGVTWVPHQGGGHEPCSAALESLAEWVDLTLRSIGDDVDDDEDDAYEEEGEEEIVHEKDCGNSGGNVFRFQEGGDTQQQSSKELAARPALDSPPTDFPKSPSSSNASAAAETLPISNRRTSTSTSISPPAERQPDRPSPRRTSFPLRSQSAPSPSMKEPLDHLDDDGGGEEGKQARWTAVAASAGAKGAAAMGGEGPGGGECQGGGKGLGDKNQDMTGPRTRMKRGGAQKKASPNRGMQHQPHLPPLPPATSDAERDAVVAAEAAKAAAQRDNSHVFDDQDDNGGGGDDSERSASSAPLAVGSGDPMALPFTLSLVSESSGNGSKMSSSSGGGSSSSSSSSRLLSGGLVHRAVFSVPAGWEAALCRHPVTCRGGSFEVSEVEGFGGVVSCEFVSTAPRSTAKAIQARLKQRLEDPAPPGAQDCCVM